MAANTFRLSDFQPVGNRDSRPRVLVSNNREIDLMKLVDRLKRYVSPQVAENILTSEEDNLFKTHRREITAFFLDLRGFTAFSDSAEPEEVLELLRAYQAEMGKIIFEFNGTLEHFAGDGITVFFNDLEVCENHTETALRMALEMRRRWNELRRGWIKKGYSLNLGIGLAAGYAAIGNIGFEGRMHYAAVGNVTNLAARLCGAAEGGQILIDQKTLSTVEDLVEVQPLQELRLKGFIRPVTAYNVVKLKA